MPSHESVKRGLPPAQVGKIPIGVESDKTGESPAVGYGLVDSTEFGGDPVALASLTDVDVSAPQDGQGLVYNADTGKWEPLDLAGGGGGGTPTEYVFGTDITLPANLTADPTSTPRLFALNGAIWGSGALHLVAPSSYEEFALPEAVAPVGSPLFPMGSDAQRLNVQIYFDGPTPMFSAFADFGDMTGNIYLDALSYLLAATVA